MGDGRTALCSTARLLQRHFGPCCSSSHISLTRMSSVHVTLYRKLPELFKRKEDALHSVSLGAVIQAFKIPHLFLSISWFLTSFHEGLAPRIHVMAGSCPAENGTKFLFLQEFTSKSWAGFLVFCYRAPCPSEAAAPVAGEMECYASPQSPRPGADAHIGCPVEIGVLLPKKAEWPWGGKTNSWPLHVRDIPR